MAEKTIWPPPGEGAMWYGLSATVLDRALAEGRMPFLRGLLARHGYRRQPMAVGLPTSTPAFQMAALYGVRPDIPGDHYHDKRRGMDIHFPRAGHPLELYDLLIQYQEDPVPARADR